MNTINSLNTNEELSINAKHNTISEMFEIEVEGDFLSVTLTLITPDDETAFTGGKDGLNDDHRHNYERYKKSLYFSATIVAQNDMPCLIELDAAITAKNRMKSTKPEDLKLMLSLYGVTLLEKSHIKRRLAKATCADYSEFDDYFDDLDDLQN